MQGFSEIRNLATSTEYSKYFLFCAASKWILSGTNRNIEKGSHSLLSDTVCLDVGGNTKATVCSVKKGRFDFASSPSAVCQLHFDCHHFRTKKTDVRVLFIVLIHSQLFFIILHENFKM